MADVIVILAAGASSRFGSPKQLFTWQGKPLVRFVAEEALAVVPAVLVVEGAYALGDALHGLEVQRIYAEGWKSGPGASIKAGVSALRDDDSVLVTLVDLPLVTRHHFAALLRTPGRLVASAYSDNIGVPAVFRSPFVAQLRNLEDACGAKPLLLSNRQQLHCVPVPQAAFDLDTPGAIDGVRLP
jgi:molybdenum cofactor cytidylyltransferase